MSRKKGDLNFKQARGDMPRKTCFVCHKKKFIDEMIQVSKWKGGWSCKSHVKNRTEPRSV